MLPGSRPPSAPVSTPDDSPEPHTRSSVAGCCRCRRQPRPDHEGGSGSRRLRGRLRLGDTAGRSRDTDDAVGERASGPTRTAAARCRPGAASGGRLEVTAYGEVRVHGPRRSGPAGCAECGRSNRRVWLHLELGGEHRLRLPDCCFGRRRMARFPGSPREHRESELCGDRIRCRPQRVRPSLLGADLRHDAERRRTGTGTRSAAAAPAGAPSDPDNAGSGASWQSGAQTAYPCSCAHACGAVGSHRVLQLESGRSQPTDGNAGATEIERPARQHDHGDQARDAVAHRSCLLQRSLPRAAGRSGRPRASFRHGVVHLAAARHLAGRDRRRGDDRRAGSPARSSAVPHHRFLTQPAARDARPHEVRPSF